MIFRLNKELLKLLTLGNLTVKTNLKTNCDEINKLI